MIDPGSYHLHLDCYPTSACYDVKKSGEDCTGNLQHLSHEKKNPIHRLWCDYGYSVNYINSDSEQRLATSIIEERYHDHPNQRSLDVRRIEPLRQSRADKVRSILSKSPKPDLHCNFQVTYADNEFRRVRFVTCPLLEAVRFEDVELVKVFLENGGAGLLNVKCYVFDIMAGDSTRRCKEGVLTPLEFAAATGKTTMLELVSQQLGLKSDQLTGPLLWAIKYKQLNSVQTLIKLEADVSLEVVQEVGSPQKVPILFHALAVGYYDVVKLILDKLDDKGVDLRRFTDKKGLTAMSCAADSLLQSQFGSVYFSNPDIVQKNYKSIIDTLVARGYRRGGCYDGALTGYSFHIYNSCYALEEICHAVVHE